MGEDVGLDWGEAEGVGIMTQACQGGWGFRVKAWALPATQGPGGGLGLESMLLGFLPAAPRNSSSLPIWGY